MTSRATLIEHAHCIKEDAKTLADDINTYVGLRDGSDEHPLGYTDLATVELQKLNIAANLTMKAETAMDEVLALLAGRGQ